MYVIALSEIHVVEGMNMYRQGVPATLGACEEPEAC
jgi:hypothetical protein